MHKQQACLFVLHSRRWIQREISPTLLVIDLSITARWQVINHEKLFPFPATTTDGVMPIAHFPRFSRNSTLKAETQRDDVDTTGGGTDLKGVCCWCDPRKSAPTKEGSSELRKATSCPRIARKRKLNQTRHEANRREPSSIEKTKAMHETERWSAALEVQALQKAKKLRLALVYYARVPHISFIHLFIYLDLILYFLQY